MIAPIVGANAANVRTTQLTSQGPEAGFSVVFDDTQQLVPSEAIAKAGLVFEYSKSLGANSVSLDFPFYEVGQTSSDPAQQASAVTSGPGTPSPQLLSIIIRMAESDGLSVQLRPLLSEEGDLSAYGVFRGTIAPSDPAAWLTSYANWLRPYLNVAQETGVASFSIGSELSSMVTAWPQTGNAYGEVSLGIHNYLPYWYSLMQMAKSIYEGDIIYSGSHLVPATVPGAGMGFDAYAGITISGTQPTSSTPTATVVSEFEPLILANYKLQVTDPYPTERVEELGIAAEDGEWSSPSNYNFPNGSPVARWVQADWITASCDAFNALGMKGLYLWSLDLTTFDPTFNADTAQDPDSLQAPATESAIEACFASITARG